MTAPKCFLTESELNATQWFAQGYHDFFDGQDEEFGLDYGTIDKPAWQRGLEASAADMREVLRSRYGLAGEDEE